MSSPDAPAATAPHLERRQQVLARLREALGDAVVGSEVDERDLWVRVRADAWRQAARACRHLGFDYFCFLSGIDWMPSTAPNPEEAVAELPVEGAGDEAEPVAAEGAEPVIEQPATEEAAPEEVGWQTGVAGGDTRFQVFARFYSTTDKLGVTFKADLEDEAPRVESIHDIYFGADWHERETWEMFGFDFAGHPGLRHLYLPSEFEGHPLRKDFPLLSREVKPWPGLVDIEPFSPEQEAVEEAALLARMEAEKGAAEKDDREQAS